MYIQMYVLGAHIIATYSNMSYPSFVAQRIFKPLDMSSTTYSAKKADEWGKATQSWAPFGRRIPVWLGVDNIMLNAGPGGVISCVDDLVCSPFHSLVELIALNGWILCGECRRSGFVRSSIQGLIRERTRPSYRVRYSRLLRRPMLLAWESLLRR